MKWLEIAKRLPPGRQQRYRHECSTKPNATVYNTAKGYSFNCFKCGENSFVPHSDRTLVQLADLKLYNNRAMEAQHNEKIQLPQDFTLNVPTEYATWLYKAGLSGATSSDHGIGWSDSLHRIVIPVCDRSGTLLYWQGRAVSEGQVPKYINPRVDKSGLLYLAGQTYGNERVIVTEDILSCIRIGRHCAAACILGTGTSTSQANRLSRYRRVTYWLDPDRAGLQGMVKGKRKLSPLVPTDCIYSDKDPKNLPDRLIRQYLGLQPKDNHTYYGHLNFEITETEEAIRSTDASVTQESI